ncbi:hypothetical protein NGRA_2817 [Nosema granulosis]|uniref:Uncharacterized protein n=1 Tax=Nosema granulosis TaxID=83296 RepID=A0A9P6KXC5_9MICR|nr:hypothetical protein NGRA_2817 [Nosema granulosis]
MYHPSSNGISERLNQTVAEVLRMYKEENIEKIKELIMRRLNTNYHRVEEQPLAIVSVFSEFDIVKRKEIHKPKDHKKNAEDNLEYLADTKCKRLSIGDKVLVRNFNRSKLDDLYVGPFEISEKGERSLWYRVKDRKEWIHYDDVNPLVNMLEF